MNKAGDVPAVIFFLFSWMPGKTVMHRSAFVLGEFFHEKNTKTKGLVPDCFLKNSK